MRAERNSASRVLAVLVVCRASWSREFNRIGLGTTYAHLLLLHFLWERRCVFIPDARWTPVCGGALRSVELCIKGCVNHSPFHILCLPKKCPPMLSECSQPVISVFLLVKYCISECSWKLREFTFAPQPSSLPSQVHLRPKNNSASCLARRQPPPLPLTYRGMLSFPSFSCFLLSPHAKMGPRTSPSCHHITFCFYLFIHLCTHACHTACRILVPWPGVKFMSPAVEAWSPNLDSQGVPSSCLYYRLNSHVSGLWLCPHWCIPTWIFLLRGPGHPVFSISVSLCPTDS